MTDGLTSSAIRQIAEGLAQRYLGAYSEALRTSAPMRGRKEINDALWGTIVLAPIEVVILDSPLLQRLRFIRQLGVVHWIYPSAVHSRFEHTLGVLFQMQQLIAGLNTANNAEIPEAPSVIGDSEAQLLRMCALLHDVGHAAFSHVSEYAIETLPEFATLSRAFSEELEAIGRGEDRQLSEILAYYIIRSPAMRGFLAVLLARYSPQLNFHQNQHENLDAIVDKMSRAMIGRKIDDRRPLLHELVSGPYDADKLDYLVRDTRCAGIPSLLDIPRLIQKIAAQALPAEELPQDIGGQLDLESEEKVWLFGIQISGIGILDELQLARMLAYTKIYRHPKVVVVEQMVHAFIHAIARSTTPAQLLNFLYSQADDAILSMDRVSLNNQLATEPASLVMTAPDQMAIAEDILKAIKERRLWVSAFQFSNTLVEEGPDASEGFDLVNEMLDHPQKREEFLALVREDVHKALRMCETVPLPSPATLKSLIMIRALKSVAGETQIGRAYLLQRGESPRPLSTHRKARGSWVEQYMADQPKAYIVSPAEYADVVFIATEKILRTVYGIKLARWVKDISKRDPDALLACQRRLMEHGYWQGAPHDIRPLPERLLKPDVKRRVVTFDKRRSTYQEPPGMHSRIPDHKRTIAWLRQFESDEDVDCALILLDHFKMLTRADTTQAFEDFMDANPKFHGAWVVPFGSAKDSSSLQAYFAADLPLRFVQRQGSLDEYVKFGEKHPLILIDDFIGSGRQATDILAAWFDRTDLRKDLGERRDPLDFATRDLLKRHKNLAFVFVAGWDIGIAAMEHIKIELGLNALVNCCVREQQIPFAEEVLSAKVPPQKAKDFLMRCHAIGADLIKSQDPAGVSDAEKVQSRALGYGNRGMLLASPVNVPTQTLTAIWAHGLVDGADWTPLLSRRKKT